MGQAKEALGIFSLSRQPILMQPATSSGHTETPTGYASNAGVDVAYYDHGTGEPLLLINGGPGFPAQHFASLAALLSERIGMRVIRFDQRGTGRTRLDEPSTENLSMAAMVADIEAVRQVLSLDAWTVMGHSFGAMVAMEYALTHRSRVKGLVLSATPGTDLSYIPRLGANIDASLTAAERQSLAAIAAEPPSYEQRLASLAVVLSTYVHDKSQLPTLRQAVVESRVFVPTVNTLVMEGLQATRFDLAPRLQNFDVPTIAIQGNLDPLGPEAIHQVAAAIPNAATVLIPGASHYLWLDQPDLYLSAIRQHFVGRPKSESGLRPGFLLQP